ncbi:hypothetical protein [Alteromonas sp. a30]|uniref:hypothetical protein n=1 Tax=Alteromonas sp. a30 TaxID=2730917 RepID=UPI00228173A4|nr:hypothetical protein [Alteromonas sp. a30]
MKKHKTGYFLAGRLPVAFIFSIGIFSCSHADAPAKDEPDNVFFTMGVHNDFGCDQENCLPERKAGEPSDPKYPAQWISDWTMFRVTNNYQDNPPPYTNPPSTLDENDYTVSYGTSYYDSTYIPEDGDGKGAMMEHYDGYCLPIFPRENNNYTCSFVSLGNKAYFLTYKDDRPEGMEECCLFSPQNHPPEQDFIKHLPYSDLRSAQLDDSVQAYGIELPSPNGPILFGYAFNRQASPDTHTGKMYRHPQSFYFSGDTTKANAPIVSQNYTNFRAEKPDPKTTWDQVGAMCTKQPLPNCELFDPASEEATLKKEGKEIKNKLHEKRGAGVWSNLTTEKK